MPPSLPTPGTCRVAGGPPGTVKLLASCLAPNLTADVPGRVQSVERPTELLREPEASSEGRIRGSWGRRAKLPRYKAGFPHPRSSSHLVPASFTLMFTVFAIPGVCHDDFS